jgi:hypothetical protein
MLFSDSTRSIGGAVACRAITGATRAEKGK